VFSVAGELVGDREKSEQWQRRKTGEKLKKILILK